MGAAYVVGERRFAVILESDIQETMADCKPREAE
jgi:hypothetical protein